MLAAWSSVPDNDFEWYNKAVRRPSANGERTMLCIRVASETLLFL